MGHKGKGGPRQQAKSRKPPAAHKEQQTVAKDYEEVLIRHWANSFNAWQKESAGTRSAMRARFGGVGLSQSPQQLLGAVFA